MNQILIKNGTIITMNPDREIIESGSVLIKDNKIAQISKDEIKVNNDTCVIDANRKVILPGLIDCHTHAGHTMVKSLGVGKSNDWVDACLKIYSTGSSMSFWEGSSSTLRNSCKQTARPASNWSSGRCGLRIKSAKIGNTEDRLSLSVPPE